MEFEPERTLVRVEAGVDHAHATTEGDGRVGRSAGVAGDMVVGEDGGDGDRIAGAAVGAALGRGRGVGGSEWCKGGEGMLVGCQGGSAGGVGEQGGLCDVRGAT